MQVNVGDIVEGKVTGLTNFGAFVKIATGEVGMVHISEVASSYVKDIKEFLAEGQDVKVKVLSVSDTGKISLSIKQVDPKPAEHREYHNDRRDRPDRGPRDDRSGGMSRDGEHRPPQRPRRSNPPVWQGQRREDNPQNFEDMMAKFKQNSDERQSDVKKATDAKHSGYSRRGSGGKH